MSLNKFPIFRLFLKLNFRVLLTEQTHTAPIMNVNCYLNQQKIVSVAADNVISQFAYENVLNNSIIEQINKPTIESLTVLKPLNLNETKPRSLLTEAFNNPITIQNEPSQLKNPILLNYKVSNHWKSTIATEGSSSTSYRSDGKLLVTGHWDNTVRLFDAKKLKPLALLK